MFAAHALKDMLTSMCILGAVGKLDAIIGQNGMDMIGYKLDSVAQELSRYHLAHAWV